MHEAHARYQQAEEEQDTRRDRPALHAVPSEEARAALRSFEATLAAEDSIRSGVRETGRGVLPERERAASQTRRAARKADAERAHAAVRDLEMQFGDDMMAPRHRPKRPSGAAADYARGERRTVQIRGQVAAPASMLRPTPMELKGPRPDRVAGWAFGFAVLVAVLALITG
jgi:hypothetical protein